MFDNDGCAQNACTADVATESSAICWMQIVGWSWARHCEWAIMELRCQGRLVARIPALMLDTSRLRAYQQAATAIAQDLERLGARQSRHWAGAEDGRRDRRTS